VADGWRWRAIPSTGITVIQATVTAFLGLMGALLFVLGMRIAVEPDQVGQSMLLLLAASVLVVIVVVLRSMIVQLVSWREAVFIVEGAPPQVLLLRGGCRKVIALADVAEVRVVYAGPADRQPTDTYLEIRRAGPRLGQLVGQRRSIAAAGTPAPQRTRTDRLPFWAGRKYFMFLAYFRQGIRFLEVKQEPGVEAAKILKRPKHERGTMKKLASLLTIFAALCALTVAASAADTEEGLLSSGVKFLAGQFLTILASIVGVYFASYVSFQRTLKHDRLVKARQRSALLTAASEELKQNIAGLRKLDERLPADSGRGVSSSEWPRLRLFVWQAVGRSTSAFDLPPKILTGMQALYEDLSVMLEDGKACQYFRTLTSSDTYLRTQYKEKLNALLTSAETALLPALDKTAAEARQTVMKYAGPASN
jgi:hypothetical protein